MFMFCSPGQTEKYQLSTVYIQRMPEEDKPILKKRLWKEVAACAGVPDAWFRKSAKC